MPVWCLAFNTSPNTLLLRRHSASASRHYVVRSCSFVPSGFGVRPSFSLLSSLLLSAPPVPAAVVCALEVSKCWGLNSGAAAADSESEGIWAMMATAPERGRESGARYHLIRVIIGMERRTSHWMEWNEVEGGEQREDPGRCGRGCGRERRSGNCGKTTSFSTTCYDLTSDSVTTFHSTLAPPPARSR